MGAANASERCDACALDAFALPPQLFARSYRSLAFAAPNDPNRRTSTLAGRCFFAVSEDRGGRYNQSGVPTVPSEYTVKPGDTLAKIARRHGLRSWVELWRMQTDEFKNAHPDPNKIKVGEEIVVPGGGREPPEPAYFLQLPSAFASRLNLSPRIPIERRTLPPAQPWLALPPPGPRPTVRGGGGRPYCFRGRPGPITPERAPLHATPPTPWNRSLGTMFGKVGSALWQCREVRDLADEAGGFAADFFWHNRTNLQRGIEIGVGLGAVSALLAIRPTREFGLGLLDDTNLPIGKAFELIPSDSEAIRFIRPIGFKLLWSGDHRRGGVLTFDFADLARTREKK